MNQEKIGLCFALCCAMTLSAGPLSASAPAEASETPHQFGIGIGSNGGVGVRYFFTPSLALDGSVHFDYTQGDHSDLTSQTWGADLLTLITAKTAQHLKLLVLVGVDYDDSASWWNAGSGHGSERRSRSVGLTGGLGGEYFFDELPRLGFGVTLTGLSISYRDSSYRYPITTVGSGGITYEARKEHSFGTGFSASPRSMISLRYYF